MFKPYPKDKDEAGLAVMLFNKLVGGGGLKRPVCNIIGTLSYVCKVNIDYDNHNMHTCI